MYVTMYADPLIIDSSLKTEATCDAGNISNYVCIDTALSATSTELASYYFGIYWANPDSTSTVLYDGWRTAADLAFTAPAAFTSYFTVTAKATTDSTFSNDFTGSATGCFEDTSEPTTSDDVTISDTTSDLC